MVTLPVPMFDRVIVCLLLDPTTTFAKLAVDGVAVSFGKGEGLTVRVATLLVTLPAELPTSTVNCAPLSDVEVGGVV